MMLPRRSKLLFVVIAIISFAIISYQAAYAKNDESKLSYKFTETVQ